MADLLNRIIKTLAGFMYVIFFRADAIAAGQTVDRIKNAQEAVGLNGIQRINGTTRVKGAFYTVLRGNKSFVKGESSGQDQLEFVGGINFQGIIGPGFSRLEQFAETPHFIRGLGMKVTD